MKPNEIRYTNTWQDVLAANRLRMRSTRGRQIGAVALALLGVVEIAMGVSEPAGEGMLLIVVGLFSCLAYPAWHLVLHFALLPRLSRRYHQQSAVLHVPITVTWSKEGLATSSALVTASLPWSAYIGQREDEAALIFFQTDMLFQFIPKRALAAEQLGSLRAAAASVPAWRYGAALRSEAPL